MNHLLALVPPLAWIIIFLALVSSVSYVYTKNRNLKKLAVGIFFTLALVGGWSFGKHFVQETTLEQVK